MAAAQLAYERKLRPIYDALDGRNFKAMLKQANAALQKYESDQLMRALKAWALAKLGKEEEACAVCDKLLGEVMPDEHVLSVCGTVLRSVGRGADITAAHEAAAAARPRDVGLLKALFAAYARDSNFVRQQQVATKLQKLDSDEEAQYAWWAVVSIALQARAVQAGAKGAMSAAQLLQLAQSMAEKRFAKGCGRGSYEAVMLYVWVLREQDKLREASQAVAGELGGAIRLQEEKLCLQAELLAGCGELREAAALARQAWVANPDSWQAAQLCLDCLLPSTARGELAAGQEVGAAADDWEAAAEAVAAVTAAAEGQRGPVRGAVLAEVELQLRRRTLSPAAGATSTSGQPAGAGLAQAVLQAYRHMGHKISCASDLRPYVAALSKESRRWLAAELRAAVDRIELEPPGQLSLDDLRRVVACYQIESSAGLPAHENADAAAAHAERALEFFAAAAHLYAGLDEKERGPADELVAVAAGALVTAWRLDASRGPRHLLRALVALEAVQRRRRVSAGLRVAAAALYGLLGAPLRADEHLAVLEIKHIQLDSLAGHLQLPPLLGGLAHEQAGGLAQRIAAFHSAHETDGGDSLMLAYASHSHTKVLEFVAFHTRLCDSYGRASAAAEHGCLQLLAAAQQGLEPARAAAARLSKVCAALPMLQTLHFNEDLSVRPAWLPPSGAGPAASLLDWWQAAPESSTAGDADCWWLGAAPGGGESAEAQAHRRAALRTLEQRVLLPQLLHGLLEDAGSPGADWEGAYSRLLSAEGLDPGQEEAWLAGLPAALQHVPLPQLRPLLELGLFVTAHALQQAGSEAQCTERCQHLGGAFKAASRRVAESASSWPSALPAYGPGWAAAGAFAYAAAWAALWLQTLAAASRRARKAKKPAGQAGGEAAELPALSGTAAAGLRRELLAALATVQETLPAETSPQKASAALGSELQLQERPWPKLESADASGVLRRLLEDQAATLQRLRRTLGDVHRLCAGCSFAA